jgi:hypothetical protein
MKGAKNEAQCLNVTVSYCPRPPVHAASWYSSEESATILTDTVARPPSSDSLSSQRSCVLLSLSQINAALHLGCRLPGSSLGTALAGTQGTQAHG